MPRIPLLALLLALPGAGCSQVSGPVEPSGDLPEAQGWASETLVTGLEHPWGIAWLPDGSALITERPGRLRRIEPAGDGFRLDPNPIAGVPPVLAEGQGGLLDVAVHPRFADNRLVYLTFAEGTKSANRTALARGRLEGGRLRDTAVIFRNPDPKNGGQHFGSRLLWLADGTLLMSIGDGGNPPIAFAGENIRNQAQSLATLFGKVLRLTADGAPAPGNPFADRPGARPEIWSYGHRNIQGMALDPVTGRVWANEHGSQGGDELNLIEPGNNYGWPEVTYSIEYWGPRISEQTTRPGVTQPKVVWTPSKAPSGLAVYTGARYPGWSGDLFSGALKFRQVRRIALDGPRASERDTLTLDARVRAVSQGPDDWLYVLTDEPNGRLLRLVPRAP
jgi:glucose/arabinose dehydrogenase